LTHPFHANGQADSIMENSEQLILDRRRLSLGKYTRWAANLSDEEMYGLLWFLGEFGIRTGEHNLQSSMKKAGRARTGLLGALGFVHGHPVTQEQAMKAIRNAYKANADESTQGWSHEPDANI
jgi:hypothetical protein